jgi:Ca2+/Na+ antiporter
MHTLEIICYPIVKPLDYILPYNRFPEIAFIIILGVFFLSIDFILIVVSVISIHTSLSHILIALTLVAWGSTPIELINLIVATKKNEMQIGLTSILSSIVFAFLIIMPFAMIFKMLKRQEYAMEVLSPIHSSHMLFLPALFVALFSLFVYWKTGMKMGKQAAFALILCYLIYLAYMCSQLIGESSS